MKDKIVANIISHLLIKEKETGKILVNKRDSITKDDKCKSTQK